MIRHMHLLSGAALAAVGMLGSCRGSGERIAMEPGEWEMTVRVANVRMDNLPPEMREEMRRMQARDARTSRDCMTVTADVIRIENLRFTIPQPGRPAAGCHIAELSMEGGRFRGQLSCEGMPLGPMGSGETMSMSGEMEGTYTARNMELSARGEMRIGERSGSAEMRFTGRRIGACPAPRPYTPPPPMPVPMPAPMPPPSMNAMPDSYPPPPAVNMAR